MEKEVKENVTSLSATSKTNKSRCQVSLFKKVDSKGNIEQDFNSKCQALIVPAYRPTYTILLTNLPKICSCKIKSGGAKFTFNNKDAIAMLTVFSDYGKVVSIVSATKLLYLFKDKKSNNNNNSSFLFCRKFTLLQNIKEQ